MKETNPPFYIGQEVVALTSFPDGSRIKNKIYTVLDIEQCKCGKWSIDIGDRGITAMIQCNYCDYLTTEFTEIEWHESEEFAPVTRLRISEHLTIAEGLAVEPVQERADVVKEIINV